MGELAENNSKTWFDQNRKRYEQSVKEPFHDLVAEMIQRIQQEDPRVDLSPKDAIFRINRDMRFAKGKPPYKTFVSALISPGGRRKKEIPGFYLELRAEHIRVYGGAYMVDRAGLEKVRSAITADLDGFERLLSDSVFKQKYGEMRGKRFKRVPSELKEVAREQPVLLNKEFYFFAELSPRLLSDDSLPEELMAYYRVGKPLSDFLLRALGF